ncbi:MAG: PKD domain-containing protein [Flavobacteriales bacterium]|nr:PKD domain-containing protein [Flavobacteriales bacterium]
MRVAFIAAFVTLSLGSFAQSHHWCGTDRHIEAAVERDPSLIGVYGDLLRITEEVKAQGERGGGPRIIPVVFHVIHTGGPENISKAQIEDQIRILNEDFSRTNPDTVNTREIFKPVAANPNVEFRLAKLDPQGNCTEGINRVYSALTNNADDAVKAVSYWNSTRYFNVWVVNSIDNDGEAGLVLGYAQFPGFGGATTDGVVVRADRVGSIEFAVAGDKGRTLTHETGHWLGLMHTFQGGCTGGFFGEGVDDTPPVAEANFNCGFNLNSCTNDNPDLPDMVENYMDYASGSCMNMFTLGQNSRMDGVMVGSRALIHSGENLAFTGVGSPSSTPCAPIAEFYAEQTFVCTGETVTYRDDSYNGEVASRSWEFPGGTPETSGEADPQVTYSQPGLYSATLTAINAQGQATATRTEYVRVISATADVSSFFLQEDFESEEDGYIALTDFGNGWERASVGFTGAKSIYVNNFSGNPVGALDEFILPSVDMRNIGNPKLYFKVAYRTRSGLSDQLRIFVSTNCGQSWSMRYNKSGNSLASVSGNQGSPFTPAGQNEWKEEDISLSNFTNAEHLLVKFQNRSDAGNNIYVDDIRISGPLSVTDSQLNMELTLSPNPATESTWLRLVAQTNERTEITVTDITGREVAHLYDGTLAQGVHNFPINVMALGSGGVYLIAVQTVTAREVLKLVVAK